MSKQNFTGKTIGEVAKELNIENKEFIKFLNLKGIKVKSHFNKITEEINKTISILMSGNEMINLFASKIKKETEVEEVKKGVMKEVVLEAAEKDVTEDKPPKIELPEELPEKIVFEKDGEKLFEVKLGHSRFFEETYLSAMHALISSKTWKPHGSERPLPEMSYNIAKEMEDYLDKN